MNAKKGFTLIEIMIVVAIIAILAAVAIPNFIAYRKTSQKNACIANLKQLDSATEAWRIKNDKKPSEYPQMSDLVLAGAKGFLKAEPKCPAGGGYKPPAGETEHWTCDYTDADYKHEITD